MADLTRSSATDDFGDVSVRCDLPRRYLLDDGEYEFGVVVIHRHHHPSVPDPPLKGPATVEVIQPP